MSEQRQGVAGLKKHDIKVSGIVFMLYCLVAAGAFGIEEMIPEAGPGMTLILLAVFPIIWAYPISNMVAECGAVMPSEGGVYVWVKEAFGEFWLPGWMVGNSFYIYYKRCICSSGCRLCKPDDPNVRSSNLCTESRNDLNLYYYQPDGPERSR